MATLSAWLQGWRTIADGLDPGDQEPITMTFARRSYEVLVVSAYEPGMEDGLIIAKTASRDFDSKVALYSRRTRDTGLVRIITNKGAPRFVLRPGGEAMEWASAIEGVPAARLLAATRPGAVGRGIARRARRENWDTIKVELALATINDQIIDMDEELEELRNEARALEREIARSAARR